MSAKTKIGCTPYEEVIYNRAFCCTCHCLAVPFFF